MYIPAQCVVSMLSRCGTLVLSHSALYTTLIRLLAIQVIVLLVPELLLSSLLSFLIPFREKHLAIFAVIRDG